ncbi:hypothetical protein Ocin01_20108 [Orchesella cincta]|uniref:Uncharacterized protein n=1 Tax=Orchesella cincta TaxID=48709 RepID=A0A1D2M0U2_ORCCI|nr:hypothetical protein Ocin01_20108 [Orchesella cincta]
MRRPQAMMNLRTT